MKKLYILLILVVCLLTGCKKCISTETSTIQVQIVDATYVPGYNTVIPVGKTMTLIYHPANYFIDVKYDDIKYSLYGYEIYQKKKRNIRYSQTRAILLSEKILELEKVSSSRKSLLNNIALGHPSFFDASSIANKLSYSFNPFTDNKKFLQISSPVSSDFDTTLYT